jgi:aspartate racemase
MVACTEFSLIADAVDARAAAFDTLDTLVDAIIAFARSAGTGTGTAGLQPPTARATLPEIPRTRRKLQ